MSELQIIALVVPVLVPVLAGWLAVRFRLLQAQDARPLTVAFLHIFLPAVIVGHLATQQPAALFNGPFILATVALILGIYLSILIIHKFLLGRAIGVSTLAAFAAAKFNAVVVGLPLLLIAVGHNAIPAVIINLIAGYFTILPITVFLLEIGRTDRRTVAANYLAVINKAFQQVGFDPLILATLAGLLLAVLHLQLPAWLTQSLSVLGTGAVAVPLVAIGMLIAGAKLNRAIGEVLWISLVRVIISPLLAILAARWLVLSPAYSISLVISFSLPTAKMAFGVAEKFGEYEEQMAEIIALTTLSMVVVFPLFLFICEHLWPGVIGRAATS